MHFSTAALLLVAPLAISALPAQLETRQTLTGYQTQCIHDTSISFDDGPYTYEKVLVDEMVAAGASGAFFVNGFNWRCIYDEAAVQSLRHAYEMGFTIGSHTWNHYDITLGTVADLGRQLDLIETAIYKILGVVPAVFRPPYGNIDPEKLTYLNRRGYTVVGWNIDTGDSVGSPIDEQISNLNQAAPGSMILAHETYSSTVNQLVPWVIPGLVKKGVKFIPIDKCLNVRPYQKTGGGYGIRDASWTCDGTPAPGDGF